jgi:hypothetical protein
MNRKEPLSDFYSILIHGCQQGMGDFKVPENITLITYGCNETLYQKPYVLWKMLFNHTTNYEEIITEMSLTPGVNIDFGVYSPGSIMNDSTVEYNMNDPYWKLGIFTSSSESKNSDNYYLIDQIATQFITFTERKYYLTPAVGDKRVIQSTGETKKVIKLPNTIHNHTEDIFKCDKITTRTQLKRDRSGQILQAKTVLSAILQCISEQNWERNLTILLWFCRKGVSASDHKYPERSIIAEYNRLFSIDTYLRPSATGYEFYLFNPPWGFDLCNCAIYTRTLNLCPLVLLVGFDIDKDIQIFTETDSRCFDESTDFYSEIFSSNINSMIWSVVNENKRRACIFIAIIKKSKKISKTNQRKIFKRCGFQKGIGDNDCISDLLPKNHEYWNYEFKFCKPVLNRPSPDVL